MKGALIALLIGLTLLVAVYFKLRIYKSNASFDIHLHDTYFVLSYAMAAVFTLLILGTFFSIGGVIGTHFKSKLFWTLTVIFLSVDTYYTAMFYKAFNHTEITSFPKMN